MHCKPSLKPLFIFLFISILALPNVYSQVGELPRKWEVLMDLQNANNYFMQKWPDVGQPIVTNKKRASNIWTRAVYYEGLMALYEIHPDSVLYKYAVDFGEAHNWNLRDGNTYTRNADNQCVGQTYIDLYEIDPQPERIKYIKASIDKMMGTDKVDDWDWIDAIQMAMPVFAKLGVMYKDPAYFERMYRMYRFTRDSIGENGLYNPKDALWWRDADFDPPYTEPNGADSYWSRGNGWVLAALARVLEIIPENAPHKKQYMADYLAMCEAIVPLQRPDGFWNVSLHDAGHFPGKELSGTALFTYALAWGVNQGYLPKSYKPVVVRAWNAMTNEALHPSGFLGYVQSTGKEPKDGQPLSFSKMPDFEDFGLGCFLLAGCEVYQMAD